MMKLRYIKFLICSLSLVFYCSNSDDFPDGQNNQEDDAFKVLFIGNSHTHFNSGLATHVEAFASSFAIDAVSQMSAPGGFTLEDHLTYEPTMTMINSEEWDAIVLQENTLRAASEPELMLESVEEFQAVFQNSSAAIYLFQTWPYQSHPEMLSQLHHAYNDARIQSGFILVSVGNHWNTFSATHTLNLYNDDGIHPNTMGTYLTAGLFFKKIFGVTSINESTYEGTLESEDAEVIKAFVSTTSL